MIEKLKEHDIIDPKTDKVIGKIGCDLREIMDKLNELVDAVNTIQKEREAERFEIQERIGILEAVRKSVNIHEKQIDELQMKAEPEKCETPADNSEKANCQENVLTMVDNQVTANLPNIDLGELAFLSKENTELKDEIDRLETELERTCKALDVAVDALKTVRRYTAINQFAPKSREAHIVAKKALAEITALEQKDVK